VIDFGQAEDGALYIAMEYVQGKDLHHILSREWPLAESRVIKLMSQVLSALADAHSASVVHRDLKPENIMVEQRRGEPDFVKVLDFGIAKILDGTADEGPALTRAGFVCGTPEYMSPEQARGAQLDHRSDLYAVGVIIYQLMTGMLPFDSDSAVGFATKHLTEVPLVPTKRRPEAKITPAMERLIMRALAKNPDDRPQTAEQFRAELLAIEKERRASVSSVRRGSSAPGLSPVRKATPADQQETKVNPHPPQHQVKGQPSPWATREETVIKPTHGRGPVPSPPVNTAPNTAPNRSVFGDGGAALVFKVATVLLVLLALSLAGLYVWQLLRQPREVYVPPTEAHTSAGSGKEVWAFQVNAEQRNVQEASNAVADGDRNMLNGRVDQARASYLRAWQNNPSTELALKLGELAWQQDKLEEAAGWWGRYRHDATSDARGLEYLEQVKQVP
jgi:serine/threonine-protein kinase